MQVLSQQIATKGSDQPIIDVGMLGLLQAESKLAGGPIHSMFSAVPEGALAALVSGASHVEGQMPM